MPSTCEGPRCPRCGSTNTIWLDYVIGYSFHCYCIHCGSDHIVLAPRFSQREYERSGAADSMWFVALAFAMLCSLVMFGH